MLLPAIQKKGINSFQSMLLSMLVPTVSFIEVYMNIDHREVKLKNPNGRVRSQDSGLYFLFYFLFCNINIFNLLIAQSLTSPSSSSMLLNAICAQGALQILHVWYMQCACQRRKIKRKRRDRKKKRRGRIIQKKKKGEQKELTSSKVTFAFDASTARFSLYICVSLGLGRAWGLCARVLSFFSFVVCVRVVVVMCVWVFFLFGGQVLAGIILSLNI